jgi:lipoate-protein ligase A
MAVDEGLLEAMPRLGEPVLRFYSWTQKAASFGYFQKYGEVERLTLLRPLVRRPAAGGLVPHDADWTYSLTFPNTHEWYSLSATESYCRVHEWIGRAFTKLKVTTELAACCRKTEVGQCFLGYEKFDLLWKGRKVAGAAQRRKREGLLIQGSVQPPPLSLAREDWQKAMCETLVSEGKVRWIPFELDAQLKKRVEELVEGKYSQQNYNRRR